MRGFSERLLEYACLPEAVGCWVGWCGAAHDPQGDLPRWVGPDRGELDPSQQTLWITLWVYALYVR